LTARWLSKKPLRWVPAESMSWKYLFHHSFTYNTKKRYLDLDQSVPYHALPTKNLDKVNQLTARWLSKENDSILSPQSNVVKVSFPSFILQYHFTPIHNAHIDQNLLHHILVHKSWQIKLVKSSFSKKTVRFFPADSSVVKVSFPPFNL